MQPIKKLYLLIGIILLFITVILISPNAQWLGIQAAMSGNQIFFPILFSTARQGPIPTATSTAGPESEGNGKSIRIGDHVAGTGDIVQITLEGINLDDMATTTLEVSFDPTVLSPLECNRDPDAQFDLLQCNLEFEEDTIRLNATTLRGVSGDIRLAEFSFEVIGESDATSPIEIEVFTFASPLGVKLEHSVQDGTFTVATPAATLAPYDLSQRIDVGPFSFYASNDMVDLEVQPIDSLVKVYENSEMRISLDYGWYTGHTPHPSDITVTIDGFDAIYNTQDARPQSDYKYFSEIFFEYIDLADPQERLGMYIWSNREDAAEVALAIFNTIDFVQEPGVYPLEEQFDVGPITFDTFEYTRETTTLLDDDPLVREYSNRFMETIVKYGDSLSYTPDDAQETLTIDGLEALYYTRETDSDSRYDSYSIVFFETTNIADSSKNLTLEIYSERQDAAEAALAIFNTIQFKPPDPDQPDATPIIPTLIPTPTQLPPPDVVYP